MRQVYEVLEEVVVAALSRDVEGQTAFDVADVNPRALGHQLLDEPRVAVVGCAVQPLLSWASSCAPLLMRK